MNGVRLATRDDYDQFMQLVTEYLIEQRSIGSEVRVTTSTLTMWGDLFMLYVCPATHAGKRVPGCDGVVAMVGDYAFSIAGSVGASQVDTDFGRVAVGHGTYVRIEYRNRGVATALRNTVREELRRLGFDTVIGAVHLGNDLGAASLKNAPFTWFQLVGYERLKPKGEDV